MKAVAAFILLLCCLAVSHAWTCKEGPRLYKAFQVDAGHGKVVARDWRYYPYFLMGRYFYRMTTARFRHVSVGSAGLWAVGTDYRVYKYAAGYFLKSSGIYARQVDAGGDGQLVGITTSYYAYCLKSRFAERYRGRGSLRWNSLSRKMRYYSCSPRNGCWGVDMSYKVYYTQRIYPTTCGTAYWRYVAGLNLKMVEVGSEGFVFGVSTTGKVYQRVGISSRRPFGTAWRYIPMCMAVRHVSYDLGKLWVVTSSGLMMFCY